MNKKTWDDDNKLDGEIIRCNTCGWEEAYSKHMDNRHDHTCCLCGWDIRQTDKAIMFTGYAGPSGQYCHSGCKN